MLFRISPASESSSPLAHSASKSLGKVVKALMTSSNRSPKNFRFGFILFVLVTLIFSVPVLAKRKHSSSSRHASRSDRGRKSSARDRRSSRRGRFNARSGRRGRVRQMSARDVRRQRQLIAREQSSGLKALERKLRRPLTKRERNAELRRIESRHG